MPIAINDQVYEDNLHYEVEKLPAELKRVYITDRTDEKDVQENPVTDSRARFDQDITQSGTWNNPIAIEAGVRHLDNSPPDDGKTLPDTTTISRMPLESPTEPAGAFKSEAGTTLPPETNRSPEPSYRPEPYGLNPPEGNAVQQYMKTLEDSIKSIPDQPKKFMEDMEKAKIESKGLTFSDEDIQKGIDMAMNVGGAGIMTGVKSGLFKGSNIAKASLGHAQVLESNGIHPDDVFTTTGWFRGKDNRWRYEIDDSVAKFDKDWVKRPVKQEKTSKDPFEQIPFEPNKGLVEVSLPEVLGHPELYKAYPQLKDVKVVLKDEKGSSASWHPDENTIYMSKKAAGNKGTLLHEIQHAVQDYEGFAGGGSVAKHDTGVYRLKQQVDAIDKVREDLSKFLIDPNNKNLTPKQLDEVTRIRKILDTYPKYVQAADDEALANYYRMAGEVESRNVQTRVDMEKNWRKSVSPTLTEDTARRDQIVTSTHAFTTPYGAIEPKTGQFVKPQSAKPPANDNKPFSEIDLFLANRQLEAKLKKKPSQEIIDEARKETERLRKVLETRDWSEIEQAKYDRLFDIIHWYGKK